MFLTPRIIVLVFSLFIYVLILVSFNKARKKYSGGKIGEVIKIILVTVILLFVAEYVYMFEQILTPDIMFIINAIFKTLALSFLAYGGTKIAAK